MQNSGSRITYGDIKNFSDPEALGQEIVFLAAAFNEPMPPAREVQYVEGLLGIQAERLKLAFDRARLECEERFPTIAKLRKLAGETDGRPGVEEAWAMCPRSEWETVVWTREMNRAFVPGARDLRDNGDEIGARMAFKEVYEREVAEARARGEAVRWEVSLGWKKADRLGPMIEAVNRGLISREYALGMTSPEQQDEMRMALPGPEVMQLGSGISKEAEKKPEVQLQGFYGVLQKIRMEGIVPEGCDPKKPIDREPLSEEQIARRKEMLRAQADLMKKRKEGDGK